MVDGAEIARVIELSKKEDRIAALEEKNKVLVKALKEIEEGTFEGWTRKMATAALAKTEGE